MRILGLSPVSTNRNPTVPRVDVGPVLESIEAGIESGRPFQISVLRYGTDIMHLAIPMTVVASRDSDGIIIRTTNSAFTGTGEPSGRHTGTSRDAS